MAQQDELSMMIGLWALVAAAAADMAIRWSPKVFISSFTWKGLSVPSTVKASSVIWQLMPIALRSDCVVATRSDSFNLSLLIPVKVVWAPVPAAATARGGKISGHWETSMVLPITLSRLAMARSG